MGFAAKPSNFELIKQIRQKKDLKLKPNPYLKEDTKLRYYQTVGSLHFLLLSRMILGDSAGLGKTLQTITGYALLLQKDPTLKLLVVTNKSAVNQWRDEFKFFSKDISIHVLTNEYGKATKQDLYAPVEELKAKKIPYTTLTSFEARQAQYQTVKAQVLITGYYPLEVDHAFLVENRSPNYFVVFDECFEYHTPILLEDGTQELIGKIVSKKLPLKVLTKNPITGNIEAKRIVNYFKSPVVETWLKVKGKRTNSVVCSPNHSFYTNIGKKKALDLKVGGTIFGVSKKYSDIDKQIILGSLLGDGSIRYTKNFLKGRDTGVRLMQSEIRLPYFDFKCKILSKHIASIGIQKSGWNKSPMHILRTEASPVISDYLRDINIVDESGRKQITDKCLYALSPVGIAIWYCDDGSLSKAKTVSLSTHWFTKEENEQIITYFKSQWGINFIVTEYKTKKLFSLRANTEDSRKFLEIVHDFIPPSMNYKGLEGCGSFWSTYCVPPVELITFEDSIEYVHSKVFSKTNTGANIRYNIEVEDNHNYFAGNILVSNCQAFKNNETQAYLGAEKVSKAAQRVYGLSATIIKNKLEEAYNIFNIIVPGLFGSKEKFLQQYTHRTQLKIKRGKRFINQKKIAYYKNLNEFRDIIEPFFLIRRAKQVENELPSLVSKRIVLQMEDKQAALYAEALCGDVYRRIVQKRFIELRDKLDGQEEISDKEQEKLDKFETQYDESIQEDCQWKNKVASLSYLQMISNGPAWLDGEEGDSSKELEFKRLFEQELLTEKVIVFTRFESGICRLEKILDDLELKHVKVTGTCKQKDRDAARISFQDPEQDITAIFITYAGSAALNLQKANVLLFYDTPWSYGDLYQTIGRAQRIGSLHKQVYILHLVNQGSIDDHVLKVLKGKKELIADVMGDIAEGSLEFNKDQVMFKDDEQTINALFDSVFEEKEGK